MKHKKLVVVILLFLCLITIGAVSAANETGDIQSGDVTGDTAISINDNYNSMEKAITKTGNNIKSARSSDKKTFADLNEIINNDDDDGEIILQDNYVYNNNTDSKFIGGIVINKDLTINGNDKIIDGCNISRIFNVTGGNVIFKNIEFVNAYDKEGRGAAINGKSTAEECTFDHNRAKYGGAVYNVDAKYCIFKYNEATNGGAAYNSKLSSCNLYNNSADNGGAGYNITAVRSQFTNNFALYGGAMMKGIAINSIFKSNDVKYDGGALYNATAINSTFKNNEVQNNELNPDIVGGAAISQGSAINCNFSYNYAKDGCTMYNSSAVLCYFDSDMASWEKERVWDTYFGIAVNCTHLLHYYETIIGTPRLFVPLHVSTYGSGKPIKHQFSLNNWTIDHMPMTVVLVGAQIDETYHIETGEDLFLNLTPGLYTVTCTVDDIPGSYGWGGIRIYQAPTTITSDSSIYQKIYGEDLTLTVTLQDNINHTISDAVLTFEYQGTKLTSKTDKNGQATIDLKNAPTGRYKIIVNYEETDLYSNTTKAIDLVVSKAGAKINAPYLTTQYNSNETLTATLTDMQGKALENVPLTVNFNGQKNYTTDKNGQIQLSTAGLKPGTYYPYIRFNGNVNYVKTAKEIKITVIKIKTILKANETYVKTTYSNNREVNITLKDTYGNPIRNATITIDADTKTKYTTDYNGQVIFSTKGLEVKDNVRIVNVEFKADNIYDKSNTTFLLYIEKDPTQITSQVIPDYLIVTLKNDTGSPVSNARLTVNMTDFIGYYTDNKGQVLVPLANMQPNNYTAQITYGGDKTRQENSTNVDVNVAPISSIYKITTPNVTAYRMTKPILDANVSAENVTVDGGKVYFQIDGKPILDENGTAIYSTVENNTVHQEYNIPENLTLGNHTITAIYISADNQRAASNNTMTITNQTPSGGENGSITPHSNKKVNKLPQKNLNSRNMIKTRASNNMHKIILNNDVVAQSNVITLEILNKIFNQQFTNGQLLIYIDGQRVYKGTTTDDISTILFNIIEKFLGQHELKVEFTDSSNNTKTYTETITLQ